MSFPTSSTRENFNDRVSLSSPGWPRIYFQPPAAFKADNLPALVFQVLGVTGLGHHSQHVEEILMDLTS